MRDASIAVLREIGVDTGGSNVQFAINPARRPHDRHRDEPARVALARRSRRRRPGFPIAKIAAKLAVGYTLDELKNDITGGADARIVRADDRLRRHQGAALRVREVPAGRRPADHADEVGRRGDGDRPHVPGVAAEGAARPRDRRRRLQPQDRRSGHDRRRARVSARRAALVRRRRVRHRHVGRGAARATRRSTRGSSRRSRRSSTSSLPSSSASSRTLDARRSAPAEAQGLLRPAARAPAEGDRDRRARAAPCARRAAGVQARRHLRGRVRDAARPTSTRPTRRSARPRRPTGRR